MFTNIALVSQSGPELKAIRHEFRNAVKFRVREFVSLEDTNQGLSSFPFNVLVVRLPVLESRHVAVVNKIRARFPTCGLITVSGEIEPSARYELRELPKHKLIHEPTEIGDLARVAEKLTCAGDSSARLHPRVKREGIAELFDEATGEKHAGKFLDFAQMGARLVVQTRTPLKRKARLQLIYRSSSEPGRIHRIAAVVMWEQITSGMMGTIVNGAQQMVGLRFIAAL